MRPKKKISQSDIAKALGISNVSVSNALAGRKGVSDDLIRRIRRTADEMGYETGKRGVSGSADFVAVVTSGGHAGAAGCFAALPGEQRLQARHYTIAEIMDGEGAETRELENASGILIPEPLTAKELRFLKEKSSGPVIEIGFYDSRVPVDCVMDDGFHGAQITVQYLRGKGYEKILYVRPDTEADGTVKGTGEPAADGDKAAASKDRAAKDTFASADAGDTTGEKYIPATDVGRAAASKDRAAKDAFAAAEDMGRTVSALRNAMWEDRLLGYRSELYLETLDNGLTMEQARPFDTGELSEILTLADAQVYLHGWENGGKRRKAAGQKQTAFFCGDMKTARALLDFLEQEQISVPDEVGVVGYMAGDEAGSQTDRQAGRRRITAYVNSEKRLLEKCCAILRDEGRGAERPEKLHLVLGEIAEGGTA